MYGVLSVLAAYAVCVPRVRGGSVAVRTHVAQGVGMNGRQSGPNKSPLLCYVSGGGVASARVRSLVNRLKSLATEYEAAKRAVAKLEPAIQGIASKERKMERDIQLIVFGQSGVGKSTLLNNLVGHHFFPTDDDADEGGSAVTVTPLHLCYHAKNVNTVEVHFRSWTTFRQHVVHALLTEYEAYGDILLLEPVKALYEKHGDVHEQRVLGALQGEPQEQEAVIRRILDDRMWPGLHGVWETMEAADLHDGTAACQHALKYASSTGKDGVVGFGHALASCA